MRMVGHGEGCGRQSRLMEGKWRAEQLGMGSCEAAGKKLSPGGRTAEILFTPGPGSVALCWGFAMGFAVGSARSVLGSWEGESVPLPECELP